MLEIDRERNVAAKLQKDLDVARTEGAKVLEQHRLESQALQQQHGDLRQHLGVLEGQLQATKATSEQLVRDIQGSQRQVTEATIRAVALESERDGWRIRVEAAEKRVWELKEQAAKRGTARKARAASTDSRSASGSWYIFTIDLNL